MAHSPPTAELTTRSPLNTIGMPYYHDTLASAWPELVSDAGAPPVKYDANFLSTLKAADFGLYGPNTRGLRRNQVEYTRELENNASAGMKVPKFLSEKAREHAQSSVSSPDDGVDELVNPLANLAIDSKKAEVPVMYRNVDIKYSRFGVDDFDFGWVTIILRTCVVC